MAAVAQTIRCAISTNSGAISGSEFGMPGILPRLCERPLPVTRATMWKPGAVATSQPAPAEAYAAAKNRAARPRLTEFAQSLPFELDGFQHSACSALEEGHGVLVCAPTGAGKTVVGEFAVHLALAQGLKCFYTTPIKALSNQKYADLVERHGADAVGLLTGDTVINGDAQVVVMTTEVLRNMIYAGSRQLDQLGYVVMDEVHYLADRFRGAVWEEVILQLPEHVSLVSLSATVSNAEEFGDWLVTVRGDTTVVVEEHRPVPLWQHMMVGNRMFDLFAGEDAEGELQVDPDLVRHTRELDRQSSMTQWDRGGRGRGRSGAPRRTGFRPPSRTTVIDRLDRESLLPAITFVFSRAGCDAAVGQCVRAGLRLTTEEEAAEIRRTVERRTADLPQADLAVLGYWEWREALERGIAAHHAGMLPAFKETVEELFVRGLVRAVFATETLALGINMPARTVVLERLVKFNGEAHVELTPGEYTQLTGRAGRRGIDVEGHAVVVWQPGVDPEQVAGLASTRTYPLRSSFRPGYNMAVNLVGRLGTDAARELLEQSFGQFQADRSVVGLARRIERNAEALAGYEKSLECHLGDFREYAALRRQVSDREKVLSREGVAERRDAAAESLRALRPGDVIAVPGGRRAGLAVVLDPGLDSGSDPRPLVLSEDRWAGRLSAADFPVPVEPLGRMRLPKHVDHRAPRVRRDLASSLRNTGIVAPATERRRSRGGHVDDPELATPAPRAAGPPVPRVRRPRGARPMGRPVRPAGARDRAAAAEGAGHHALAGEGVRPDQGAARGAGLPRRRRGHRARPPARAAVGRVGPARGGVPAPRRVGGARPSGAGGRRVRAGLRVAAGQRADAAGAVGAGVGGAGGHSAAVGGAGGRRAPAPGRPHPRAGPRVRLADAPLGPRGVAVGGAHGRGGERRRAVRGRFRALDPSGARPARPGRRGGRAGQFGGTRRRRGGDCDPSRGGRRRYRLTVSRRCLPVAVLPGSASWSDAVL